MGFQSALEYRADFILSMFTGVFVIIIQCFLWAAVFAAASTPVVYGYTFPEMISYSIVAGIVARIVATGFELDIAEDIKNGGLSKFIVQPIGYFYFRIFSFLGKKALQSLVLFFISIAVLLVCSKTIGLKLDYIRILIFIPASFLAMLINFLIYYSISALAFVMAEVWGVFAATGQGVLMLSGGIFPLDVFGDKAAMVLGLLPFKYIVFFPVNIVNGRLTMSEILSGVILQIVWILVLLVVAVLSWKSGMKKYVAVGG